MKMTIVPQTSPLDVERWIPFLIDLPRQSFSHVLRWDDDHDSQNQWTTREQLDSWFDALHPSNYKDDAELAWTDSYYKGNQLLRKTAWCTLQEGCECDYGYSDTWQRRTTSTKLQQTVRELTQVIQTITGCTTLNSCNLNFYPQGGGVGFHADDEFLFDGLERPTCIISLSLCRQGGARKFLVKEKQCHEYDAQDEYPEGMVHETILHHGDVMTMEGMFQKYYFHSVWPGDSKDYMDDPLTRGERINLTWRTIVKHLDGSSECRGKVCPLSTQSSCT
jgi:alkylated DNA repair dioxygenase AlkB